MVKVKAVETLLIPYLLTRKKCWVRCEVLVFVGGDILVKGGAKGRVSVACLGSYWAVETLCNVVRIALCLSPPLNR